MLSVLAVYCFLSEQLTTEELYVLLDDRNWAGRVIHDVGADASHQSPASRKKKTINGHVKGSTWFFYQHANIMRFSSAKERGLDTRFNFRSNLEQPQMQGQNDLIKEQRQHTPFNAQIRKVPRLSWLGIMHRPTILKRMKVLCFVIR